MQKSQIKNVAFFDRQLQFYQVAAEQLRVVAPEPDQQLLSLSWYPERSMVPPLRIERNHIAVFAWSELALAAGQKLVLTGPWQEKALLLIENLHLAPGSELVLMMPVDLIVGNCEARPASGGAEAPAKIVSAAADGASGPDGVAGVSGRDAEHPDVIGGCGGHGGEARPGCPGANSCDALVSLGRLEGSIQFEIRAGRGGAGGIGGRGGRGGQGGLNPHTRKMAMGGNGGNGGAGGYGGNGGNGGLMRVWIQEMAAGAEHRCHALPAAGGSAGAAGNGGLPGLGHPDGSLGLHGVDGCAGAAGQPGIIELYEM